MEFSEMIKAIDELATEEEIDAVLNTALNQRRKMFPDWDMIYLALPKSNIEERREALKYAMDLLMKENWMGVKNEL